MRTQGRQNHELRPIKITRKYTQVPNGSVLIEFGETVVLCTAMVEDKVPPFLEKMGKGWVSAEYAMLPGSTQQRKQRERGKQDSRSIEIQRLIGRSLRATVNTQLLGERTIWLDCDVLQADGGTRTAAITGAYVALRDAVQSLRAGRKITTDPMIAQVAAVSAGIVKGQKMLDLCYEEDSNAEVDMNVVMLGNGEFVELQATGERRSFSRVDSEALVSMAEQGIRQLMQLQNEALAT